MKGVTLALSWGATIFCRAAISAAEPPDAIAVLKDDLPAVGVPSSPDCLATVLERAALATAFWNSRLLAPLRAAFGFE